MSLTPRTDAAISIMGAVSQEEVVSAEVCRSMELDLKAARMALQAWQNELTKANLLISFFACALKSGEPWSASCEEMLSRAKSKP